MKIGFSLLLSEYVDAKLIEYGDCKTFQVVCPNCKEPIFKVARQTDDGLIHYLSHYEKSKAYVSECELRISKISEQNINQTNLESRNQKIKYFFKVFKNMVIESQFSGNFKNLHSLINQINRQKAIQKVKELCFNLDRKNFFGQKYEGLEELFNDYIKDIEKISGDFPKTSFAISVQKRIAYDFLQHLLSAQSKENFDFLFNVGYLYFFSRLEQSINLHQSHEWEKVLYKTMASLLQSNKERGFELLSELNSYPIYPPFSMEYSNLLIKMVSEIHHEMLGILLRLPYFEWLKRGLKDKFESKK